jgi:HSP20 family protein
MTELARRSRLSLLPDVRDLLNPMHLLPGWLTPPQGRLIRVEAYFEDDAYVVRAELPDIDPDKDAEVTIANDALTIQAERTEQHTDTQHSEFRYGSFIRTLPLPRGYKQDAVRATYHDGILTVRIGLQEQAKAASHTIKVTSAE